MEGKAAATGFGCKRVENLGNQSHGMEGEHTAGGQTTA